MVDTELLANALRAYGHTVTKTTIVPNNAGMWEFHVDGNMLTLEEARDLLAADEDAGPPKHPTVIPNA